MDEVDHGFTTTKVKVTMKNKRGMVLAMVWLIAGSGASVIRIYSNQQATEELGLYFLRFIITTVLDVEGWNDRRRNIRIWSNNKHRREVLFLKYPILLDAKNFQGKQLWPKFANSSVQLCIVLVPHEAGTRSGYYYAQMSHS